MSNTHSGEAVIRKAFYRSLLTIVVAIIAGSAIYYFSRQEPESLPAKPQEIKGPVIKQAAADKVPEIMFTDITRTAGLDFIHTNGAYGDRLLPETMGAGCGFIDYDNDGDQDIVLVNATFWPGQPQAGSPTTRLYNNDGTGHFTDVTDISGIAINSYGMGLAVGDYDNDGWDDVYITTLHKNYMLHNEQGKFVDVSDSSGTAGFMEDWSTAAVFFDFDNDSDLDLFVANYVEWTPQINREIDFRVTGIGKSYSTPTHYAGAQPRQGCLL